MNISSESKAIKLQILLDKSSLEVFVNDGGAVLSAYIYPDEDADGISAFATNGNATIKSLQIWNLSGTEKQAMISNDKLAQVKK